MATVHKTPSSDEIAETLTHLQLSTTTPHKPAQKPKSKPVAESWDEESGSGSDTETDETSTKSAQEPRTALHPLSTTISRENPPGPPPPTPASPTQFEYPDTVPYQSFHSSSSSSSSNNEARRGSGAGGGLDKRPEKTTAVAGRLIAGALGVRAPKRSEEEREFDRVMREKERRRRAEDKERERREAEERERRMKAVWDD
ncbi:hypothetical protein BDW02DRAFT_565347 [Decorospora gaudefroyi]|uniref:Ubiquitin-like protein smt3 n=1 Tax=Decorospora gaudefroyi TaxID=184978 RepID=A0A6A5KLW9_9PLEO|nr:hypothetical protein BDW02DRAFT_565347 [Decorospora gaudefroyi]